MDPILSHFSLANVTWHILPRFILMLLSHLRLGVASSLLPNKTFICVSCFSTSAALPCYTGLQNECQNATMLKPLVYNFILFYFILFYLILLLLLQWNLIKF